jgi:hypothetical protein
MKINGYYHKDWKDYSKSFRESCIRTEGYDPLCLLDDENAAKWCENFIRNIVGHEVIEDEEQE